jgi:hypothetical protein
MGVATQAQVDALINVGGRRLTDSEFVAAVEETLVTNVMGAMEKLGVNLVLELEKNTPVDSGRLASSYSVIGVKETKTGYRLEINVGADYADYIDKGVRGIQNRRKTYKNAEGRFYQFKTYGMPPEALKGLEGWAARKNIELEATGLIEGRKNLPQITSPASRLAYYIKKYGIEGRNFKKKSFDAVLPDFEVDIKEIGANSLVLKITK